MVRYETKQEIILRPYLTPSQWLPKPATSQFPHKRRSLRETWSLPLARAGEGENNATVGSPSGRYRKCEIKM